MPKTLLVTGGSRGIGAAVALRAAADGYDVALTYAEDSTAARGVVDGIEAAGRRAVALHADVAREADVLEVFTALDEEFGALDAVVINAGITGRFSRVDELDAATLERVMAVNVIGAFLCAREAVRRMSTAHGGRGGAIAFVSSRAASLGSPGEYVHYAASKGAVNTLTVGLAKEVAREGVRVNAISPGMIATEIHARAGQPERLERIAPLIPMGRAGTADEIAAAILWIVSPAASYVTGAVLDIGGGR
ncbi:MAG TPA: SDR family oxidoreductase [Candidatus Elarobacter sp.]|nr:SDR family oxidoreductase [Candidatus Elarobacter sp.]